LVAVFTGDGVPHGAKQNPCDVGAQHVGTQSVPLGQSLEVVHLNALVLLQSTPFGWSPQ
jgi:hypothetical protein